MPSYLNGFVHCTTKELPLPCLDIRGILNDNRHIKTGTKDGVLMEWPSSAATLLLSQEMHGVIEVEDSQVLRTVTSVPQNSSFRKPQAKKLNGIKYGDLSIQKLAPYDQPTEDTAQSRMAYE
ncbi:hypothetical protein AVEN_34625-1 [Araneus ventricosus]|uniref:Uncharacterized protein n=1 Tax=Araneus ventricosus TaxID=182803 RepID=A0A4Y2B052_ARAVE|nr:hypothetical protein AVEN_34625-1 [Araneus ventricosus]